MGQRTVTINLERKSWTHPFEKTERNAAIVALCDQGVDYGRVAALYGLSRQRIHGIYNQARVKREVARLQAESSADPADGGEVDTDGWPLRDGRLVKPAAAAD